MLEPEKKHVHTKKVLTNAKLAVNQDVIFISSIVTALLGFNCSTAKWEMYTSSEFGFIFLKVEGSFLTFMK